MSRLLLTVALMGVVIVLAPMSAPTRISAHHDDNGHSGYLFLPGYELNARTSTGQPIPITAAYSPTYWLSPFFAASSAWNNGASPTTGFGVYTSGSGYVTMNAGPDVAQCGFLNGDPNQGPSHGCPLQGFNYNTFRRALHVRGKPTISRVLGPPA